MAERGGVGFRPWGQGRARGRGRGRGRSRDPCQYLLAHCSQQVGHLSEEQPTESRLPPEENCEVQQSEEQKNLPTQIEKGVGIVTCSPDDTPSPCSSSSSKRSCTEVEENEEAKGTLFVKRRCKKILSTSFQRDSDRTTRELHDINNMGKATKVSENVNALEREMISAEKKSCADSYRLVQISHNSPGSIERECSKGTEDDASADNASAMEKGPNKVEVKYLSSGVLDSYICMSNVSSCKNAEDEFNVMTANGTHSLSSPTPGSKARPHFSNRSHSDSWVTSQSPSSPKKKERPKRRRNSTTLLEQQESSDEEIRMEGNIIQPKGVPKANALKSGHEKFGVRTARLSFSVDDETKKNDDRQMKFVKDNTNLTEREEGGSSEVCDADIDSSGEEGDCSPSEDENWHNVVKKLSAEGADTEEVPSTLSKMTELYKEAEANCPKYMYGMYQPAPTYRPAPTMHSRMDAPLQFRPGFRERFSHPRSFYPVPFYHRNPVSYGPLPPNQPWSMGNPYIPLQSSMFQRYAVPTYPSHYPEEYPQYTSSFVAKSGSEGFTENVDVFKQKGQFSDDKIVEYDEINELPKDNVSSVDENMHNSLAMHPQSLAKYGESFTSPECTHPQHLIPRQVVISTKSTSKCRTTSNENVALDRQYPHQSEWYDGLTSTEDSTLRHMDSFSAAAKEIKESDKNISYNLKQNWYDDSKLASSAASSAQRRNRVWGKSLKQMTSLTSESAKPQSSVSPQGISDYPVSLNPPSYASVASTKRSTLHTGMNREGSSSFECSTSSDARSSKNDFSYASDGTLKHGSSLSSEPSRELAPSFESIISPGIGRSTSSQSSLSTGVNSDVSSSFESTKANCTRSSKSDFSCASTQSTDIFKKRSSLSSGLSGEYAPLFASMIIPSNMKSSGGMNSELSTSFESSSTRDDLTCESDFSYAAAAAKAFNKSFLPSEINRDSSLSIKSVNPSNARSLKSGTSLNSLWQSSPFQTATNPQSAYRQWSAGSQGWDVSSITSVDRRASEPPKPKAFGVGDIQRPRRLSLEDTVREETIQRMTSWRSSSVSEDIQEVPYPVCDVDYIDSHSHIDLLFQRCNYKGTFSKYASTNKFPANFAGCVAIFCYPVNFSRNNTFAQDLLEEANIWGSFGCHPHQAKHYDGVMEERIKEWMKHSKTVALGEIGLDYSNRPAEVTSDHELQKMIFRRQLQLALDVKKPLVIHCRDAEEDTLRIMTEMVPRNHKIHRHCFTGPPDDAITFLRAFPNSFIGLTALVTFPSATNTHQTARAIPLNRLLLETDTPYFVPRKVKGTKWSHPAMALLVAERIAQLRGIPLEEVLTAVRANTMAMYGI